MKSMIMAILFSITSVAFADFSQLEVETDLKGSESISLFHAWDGGAITPTFFGQRCEGGWSASFGG